MRWKKRQKKIIEIVVTTYDARISELRQQISILEKKKCEVEENPSYMEGLIKNKEKVVKWHCKSNLPRPCHDGCGD